MVWVADTRGRDALDAEPYDHRPDVLPIASLAFAVLPSGKR